MASAEHREYSGNLWRRESGAPIVDWIWKLIRFRDIKVGHVERRAHVWTCRFSYLPTSCWPSLCIKFRSSTGGLDMLTFDDTVVIPE